MPRHRLWRLLGGVCLVASEGVATTALAQELVPAPVPVDQVELGVVPYPSTFFAEFRPQTAMDMLSRLPGFSFDGGSSARGFAGNAGNVLIDGERPPSRNDSLSSVISRIPASSVLRIDLVRGGAGGIDMQGKTVVANIIRKKDAGVKVTVNGQVRADGAGRVSPNGQIQAQRSKNGRSFEGSFGGNLNSNIIDNDRTRRTPSGALLIDAVADGLSTNQGYQGAGSYEGPFAGGRVRLNGQGAASNGHFNLRDTLLFPGGAEISSNEFDQKSGEAGLRFTRKIFGDTGLEIVGFQQLKNNVSNSLYDTPAFSSTTRGVTDSGESIVSAKLQPKARGHWTFEAGAEAAFNFVESRTDYGFNGAVLLLPGDTTRVEELRTETFVTTTWAPKPALSVEAGVRYERSTITTAGSAGSSDKSLGFVKPRLNIAWTPKPGHQLGLRIERKVDQLSFGSFAASASFSTGIFGAGNPELEPAKSWVIDGRYEYRFGKQGSVVLEYVHDDIVDLLGRVVVLLPDPAGGPPKSFEITRNVATARRDSFSVNTTLPLEKVGVGGGLLSLYARWRTSATVDPVTLVDRSLSNDDPFEWSLSFSQNIVSRRISWGFGANGRSRNESFSPRSIGRDVQTWGMGGSINYRPNDKLSIGVGVNNPTRVQFTGISTQFDAPRNVGKPLYTEVSHSKSQPSVFVNVRKTF